MSQSDEVKVLPGGAGISIQFGKAEEVQSTPDNPLEGGVKDGSSLRIGSDGKVEQFGGITRATANNEPDSDAGILASARRAGDRSRTAPITDRSVVRVAGIDMSVANAIHQGYLMRDGHGGYVETGRDPAKLAEGTQAPVAPATPEGVGLLPETEQTIAHVESSLPMGLHAAFTHELMTRGADAAVAKFAGYSTLDPAALKQSAAFVEASYQAHLAHHLSKSGIGLAEFSAWVRQNAAGEAKSAAISHAHTRRASAWDALIERYVRQR